MISRRHLIGGALAVPFGSVGASAQQSVGEGGAPIYLSDMHFHSFFGPEARHSRPVGQTLAAGNATLVAWSITGDGQWIHPRTLKQVATPRPGDTLARLHRVMAQVKAHMAEQSLQPALVPADVDAALRGEPRIVLSVEGASFIESDPGRVKLAYDLGIRHLQLVHYIKNTLGDFQTEPPEHNGLTGLGREVIAECNRLGILVDLAHATPRTVEGALAVAKAPVIWSHGSVTAGPMPHPGLITWRARQLPLSVAKSITATGGVVGLWLLRLDVGGTMDDYARRLLQMADWLGDDHVAFGTDINGLGPNAIGSTYAELRQVVERWQRNKVPEARIRRIASLNYARVLKSAMDARKD